MTGFNNNGRVLVKKCLLMTSTDDDANSKIRVFSWFFIKKLVPVFELFSYISFERLTFCFEALFTKLICARAFVAS